MNWMLAGLVAWNLGAGPAPVRLAPRLSVGQEFSYRGTLVEKTANGGAKYEQPFDLDATMLVLDVDAASIAEVGCYTEVRFTDKVSKTDKTAGDNVRSSHFALLKVAPRGIATWASNDAGISMPADGRPIWELGYLVEMPKSPVSVGDKWTVRKEGQQPIECRCVGMDSVRGVPCVRMVCTQSSPTWNTPGNQLDWRTESTCWLNLRDASVLRLSRTHEVRRPGEKTANHCVCVDYELTTAMKFQGMTFQERVGDFRAGVKAQSALEVAFANMDGVAKNRFNAIKQQLKFATDELFNTPYRPALVRMRTLAERAAANPSQFQPEATVLKASYVEMGQKARNFTLHNAETNESINLKKSAGRPLLIVMVDPKSHLSWAALDAALKTCKNAPSSNTRLVVVCKDADATAIAEMKERYPGNYEVCSGSGFDRSYGVKGMPHTIFIDAEGVLRCNHSGYGPEMCSEVATAIKQHGQGAENLGKKEAARGTFLR